MRWVLGFTAPDLETARQIVWDRGGLTREEVTESGLPGFWAVTSADKPWLDILQAELAGAGERTEMRREEG